LKHFRPALLLLAVAFFSASAWADGIDPKVIIQKGSGSIAITGSNTMFAATATTAEEGNTRCLTASDACVFEVFQNRTSQAIHTLTIAINDLQDFSFQCGDFLFFSSCSPSEDGHQVTFSGGPGIPVATRQCEEEEECQFKGGEFGLLIDATASEGFDDKFVSGQVLTTPEPDGGIMILSAGLAFGLLKLLRRGA
jgi:hypothetical protein